MERRRNQRKWSFEEDQVLLRYVKNSPYNLHRCFMMVSEHLTDAGYNRTPQAVQAHWYTVLSKKPESLCFFTASAKHVSKNRKNGIGTPIKVSVWNKIMAIITKVCK